MNAAYQQIIGMGRSALPLIFGDLESHGGHWFGALLAITGHDPVPDEDKGNVQAMHGAWLQWAREHGYLRGSSRVRVSDVAMDHVEYRGDDASRSGSAY